MVFHRFFNKICQGLPRHLYLWQSLTDTMLITFLVVWVWKSHTDNLGSCAYKGNIFLARIDKTQVQILIHFSALPSIASLCLDYFFSVPSKSNDYFRLFSTTNLQLIRGHIHILPLPNCKTCIYTCVYIHMPAVRVMHCGPGSWNGAPGPMGKAWGLLVRLARAVRAA